MIGKIPSINHTTPHHIIALALDSFGDVVLNSTVQNYIKNSPLLARSLSGGMGASVEVAMTSILHRSPTGSVLLNIFCQHWQNIPL